MEYLSDQVARLLRGDDEPVATEESAESSGPGPSDTQPLAA